MCTNLYDFSSYMFIRKGYFDQRPNYPPPNCFPFHFTLSFKDWQITRDYLRVAPVHWRRSLLSIRRSVAQLSLYAIKTLGSSSVCLSTYTASANDAWIHLKSYQHKTQSYFLQLNISYLSFDKFLQTFYTLLLVAMYVK